MPTIEECRKAYMNASVSDGLSEKDVMLYEALKDRYPVQLCVHPPPMLKSKYVSKQGNEKLYLYPDPKRRVGKSLVVYMNRLVIHEWR